MLTSKKMEKTTIIFFYLSVFSSSIGLVLSVIHLGMPEAVDTIDIIRGIIALLYIPVLILTVIFLSIWLYKFHKDAAALIPGYSISGKGALARFWIPLYNIWGIWNIFATFKDHLEWDTTDELHDRLSLLIPLFYALFFISRALGRVIFRGALPADMELYVMPISDAVDIAFFVSFIVLIKTVGTALERIPAVPAEESEHGEEKS